VSPSGRSVPPLITSGATSWGVRLRDVVLTLVAWALVALLLRDFFRLSYDYLKYPHFELSEPAPTWDILLGIFLRHHFVLSGLVLWVLSWAFIFSYRRRTLLRHKAQPPAVRLAELAASSGIPEGELARLEEAREVEVRFGPGGRIDRAVPVAWERPA
jgi:poly-beta-1,6-N-acetyl-D-glucosamine biosynthesis protein PgaD